MIRRSVHGALTLAESNTHPDAPLLAGLLRDLIDHAPPPVDEETLHLGYWDAADVVAEAATRRLADGSPPPMDVRPARYDHVALP